MKSRLPKDRLQPPRQDNNPFFDKNRDNHLLSQPGNTSFFTKPVQARLRIGQQDDAYENEANQVAAGMFGATGMSLPAQAPAAAPAQAEPDKQRAATLEGEINDAKGGGQSLPADVKSHMEPAFNTDFSQVKVHTGSRPEALTNRINAYAFTYDNNIFYGKGQQPGVNPLTTHELTHVAQQQGGTNLSSQPAYPPGKQAQSNSAVFKKDTGEFTSTDTKENLRGGKRQQQKVSKQESPKTLRSCSSSPSFSPPIGHKNTKLKGIFGDFEVEHGLDKAPSASGFGDYFFKVEMTPNEKTKGSKIAFVQTVRSGAPGGKWFTKKEDPNVGEDRAKRTTAEGWRLDRANPAKDKTPFYGMAKDASGKLTQRSTTRIGEFGGNTAMMRDVPGVADPDAMQFAATAMDMSTGVNYGTVAWGYEYDSSKNYYKEETPRLLDPADPRMKGRDEALKKWNTAIATPASGIDKVPGI
ncbi:DUF4157 domain-containing protein [uncultured Chitinophaga sp.]|jgi:hypothetical protein|uniref:eCIS core domain-containing protein n=1 Tax=uncultured Chitinophaga sp. TaxID=339340 RepID=UPI002605E8B4|nr:DUF4157 domain-containing protein [uncultured Chitinophaga sp.]